MTDHSVLSIEAPEQRPRAALTAWIDAALAHRLAVAARRQQLTGQLAVRLPSGREIRLGSQAAGGAALHVRRYRALARIARRGLLGFAEAYVAAEIETPSLPDLIEWFLANEAGIVRGLPALARSSRADRRYHAGRVNTRSGSRRNIAAHYDLGNDFYRPWLDTGMSYSSAIYRQPHWTLEQAQSEKHRVVLEALRLRRGTRLLEIGCGWGSVVEAAALAGADVTAVTISREQLAETRDRIANRGIADRARVAFQDYRDIVGVFDRVVSIEMIEAVGEEHWPQYFRVIADRLRPGGTAVVQAITIDEKYFAAYRARPDFIQRFIFPGGMLPTVDAMRQQAGRAGLSFETVERFGASYAATLAEWRRRFHAAWPEIERQGFDGRFRRMWHYYLCYCEAGFRHGFIDVGLYRFTKQDEATEIGRRTS